MEYRCSPVGRRPPNMPLLMVAVSGRWTPVWLFPTLAQTQIKLLVVARGIWGLTRTLLGFSAPPFVPLSPINFYKVAHRAFASANWKMPGFCRIVTTKFLHTSIFVEAINMVMRTIDIFGLRRRFQIYLWWRFPEPILFEGSPFNSCNLLVRFSTKTTLLPFSIYLQTEDAFSTCTVNYVLVQIYKCGSTLTERCKVKYVIYIYNELRTFPNVQMLLSNLATAIDSSTTFLQLFKYTSVILKSDRPRKLSALTINTWLI